MKRMILTVGPQYAGKSMFCVKVAAAWPEVVLVSRDAILFELFGTVWLDRYTGGHFTAIERMWKVAEDCLRQSGRATLILDTWNGTAKSRREIAERALRIGAERVDGWYFVTPEEQCLRWRLERTPWREAGKPEPKESLQRFYSERYAEAYRAFHAQPIEREGVLDAIRRIDPREPLPSDLLCR